LLATDIIGLQIDFNKFLWFEKNIRKKRSEKMAWHYSMKSFLRQMPIHNYFHHTEGCGQNCIVESFHR